VLEGKTVKANDFTHIRVFSPGLRCVDVTPAYGDSYIIADANLSKQKFQQRFQRSILMKDADYDIDLTNRHTALQLLNTVRSVDAGFRRYVNTIDDEPAFWNAVKIYALCGRYLYDPKRQARNFYPVFLNLGADKRILLAELAKLQHAPVNLLFSMLLEFLVKVQNVHDISGIRWKYRRDLLDVAERVSNVRRKVDQFLASERRMTDFIFLVLTL
jgi:hypothetical protein